MSQKIKIYGERNTNTNYMQHLIQLNLDVFQVPGVVPDSIDRLQNKVQRLLPGNEMVKDLYFAVTYGKNLGWKHTCVKSVDQLKKYKLVDGNLNFLTITKNPYSWLLSLYRRPYHQYYDKKPDFKTFLQEKWKTIGRDNCTQFIENPIQLWNIKNRSYLQLNEFNTLNITAEEIFKDPEKIIEKMSRQFSLRRLSNQFINYDLSTKGESKNSQYYRDYYLQEKWKDQITEQEVLIINKSIDIELVSYFGYSLEHPFSYPDQG